MSTAGQSGVDGTAEGDSGPAQQSRARKSANAFRTISEVSEALDIPQHVLRFWETKFSQIKPMKRGGGRRYYRPEDIVLLLGIRDLLYVDGYTIKGVQRLLREGGVRVLQRRAGQADTKAEGGREEAAVSAPTAPDTVPIDRDGANAGSEALRDALRDVLAELEALKSLISKAR